MKKTLGTILGIGMMLASAVPAFAATEASNTLTGPDSYNKIRINRTWKTSVNNIQTAYVSNKVKSENNTGENKIKGNTLVTGSGIETGNAASDTAVTNNVNGALTAIGDCGCPEGVTATNDTTGPDSTNKIYVSDTHKIKVNNYQTAYVSNYVNSNNNTGGNSVSHNTVAEGGVTTGDATSNVTVENWVNGSETIIGPVAP